MMHPNETEFHFSRTLSCGCNLETSVIWSSAAAAVAEELAGYWFETRRPRHRCELVTGENPNGLTPQTPHEARLNGAVDLSRERVDRRHADR